MDKRNLAGCYSACFKTPAGKQVLEHLKQLTIMRSTPPEMSNEELRWLEGGRGIVFMILNFIKQGENNNE